MAEYIEKKKLVNSLKMWLMDLENDMDKGDYGELCENKGAREAVESCICEVEEQPLADVQPIDRWINVNDRLPKEQETVIVYEKDYGVMWGDYQGIKYSQPVWIVRKSGLIIRTTEVTHWQPLPEPPKE